MTHAGEPAGLLVGSRNWRPLFAIGLGIMAGLTGCSGGGFVTNFHVVDAAGMWVGRDLPEEMIMRVLDDGTFLASGWPLVLCTESPSEDWRNFGWQNLIDFKGEIELGDGQWSHTGILVAAGKQCRRIPVYFSHEVNGDLYLELFLAEPDNAGKYNVIILDKR